MVSVMDGYVSVCALSALPARGRKLVHVNGVRVLLVACDSGYYAVEDKCPQTGRSLAHGKVLNCVLTSSNNGARYDIATGKYLGGGQSPFQSHWLRVFPVQIVGDQLYIRITS